MFEGGYRDTEVVCLLCILYWALHKETKTFCTLLIIEVRKLVKSDNHEEILRNVFCPLYFVLMEN